MRQKLVYAQGLLEGVTLDKFDLIITNATALRDMSATNAFLIVHNPDYLHQISNFQRNVDALTRAAKKKDPNGSLAAYQKVAQSCVDCHRYFRKAQNLQLGDAATQNKSALK